MREGQREQRGVAPALIKKKIKFSHIQFKEIETGAVAKSYMRKGFQLYEEMCKYLVIFEEALVIYDFAAASV
jgi:hypothetical protein